MIGELKMKSIKRSYIFDRSRFLIVLTEKRFSVHIIIRIASNRFHEFSDWHNIVSCMVYVSPLHILFFFFSLKDDFIVSANMKETFNDKRARHCSN